MALGQTVGELQSKISWSEYELWLEYREKYGPLDPIRKYDLGYATVAAQINQMNGGTKTAMDFLYYNKEEKEEEVSGVSIESFVKALGGVKIGQRKRG